MECSKIQMVFAYKPAWSTMKSRSASPLTNFTSLSWYADTGHTAMQMMRQENLRLLHEQNQMKEKIADNAGKIKQNKVLPYLVANVVEVSFSPHNPNFNRLVPLTPTSHHFPPLHLPTSLPPVASPQILDINDEGEEQGATKNEQNTKKGKCAVVKTSSRQTVFLPMIGLVPADKLKPGDLIGVNKDSYLVLDTLPAGEWGERFYGFGIGRRSGKS